MDNNQYNIDNIQFSGAAGMVPPKKKKSKMPLVIGAVILVALLLFVGLFGVLLSSSSDNGTVASSEPYIGVLHIRGEIGGDDPNYNQSYLLNQIKAMKKDENNKGILLYVNSPGGSVFQTDEVYQKILDYQEKTGRPVYAYFHEIAASGAYYIAAPSEKIIANRFTTTGSIGVYYGPLISAHGLMENLGISGEYIKSSENKAMGNYFDELTDEQRAILQEKVDEIYNIFVGIVADGRGMDEATVRQIADGRTYSASQAKANGLIDEIGDFAYAKKLVKKETGVDTFITLKYVPERTWQDYFFGMSGAVQDLADSYGKSEEEKMLEYLVDGAQSHGKFMVMMQE